MWRVWWTALYWGVFYVVLSFRGGRPASFGEFFWYYNDWSRPLALIIFGVVLLWGDKLGAVVVRLPGWTVGLLVFAISFALAHWYGEPFGALLLGSAAVLIWRQWAVNRARREYAEDLKYTAPPRPGSFSARSSSDATLEDEGLV
jgi:hypothetical protein